MGSPPQIRVQDEQGNTHVFPGEASPEMIAHALNVKPPAPEPEPAQPSPWQVLTQPTDKTDAEYGRYTGASGVAAATVKGLDDVARGTQGALGGIWNTLKTAARAWNDPKADVGDTILPDPHIEQVPGAIKDINASKDPLGYYAKAAQDTASQGAGQAIVGIGAEGMARGISAAADNLSTLKSAATAPIRLASRTAETALNQKLIPLRKLANLNVPADEAEGLNVKVPGRDLGLPQKPSAEVLQAGALRNPGQPIASPSDALGQIKQAASEYKQDPNYQVVSIPAGKTAQSVGPAYTSPRTPDFMEPAQSSNVSLHGYHPESQTMTVQFRNGNVYELRGVPPEMYRNYQNSESQGSFYQQNLKGRYDTRLVGKVAPTAGAKVKQALSGQ